jgi:hypothetical protein
MKCLRFLAVVPLMLMLCGRASAHAITVDEFGVGTIQSPGGTEVISGHLGPDPGPGGLNPVLIYPLPFTGVQGDVNLTESTGVLDVLRFNGDGTLIFYSDNLDGFDAPGDTPTPPRVLYANQASIPEIGLEGDNGAFYTPAANAPGFDPSGPTYHFISDGHTPVVPEPSSLALLLGGLLSGTPFGLSRLRRR